MAVMIGGSGGGGTVNIKNAGAVIENVSAKVEYELQNYLFSDITPFTDIEVRPEVEKAANNAYTQTTCLGDDIYCIDNLGRVYKFAENGWVLIKTETTLNELKSYPPTSTYWQFLGFGDSLYLFGGGNARNLYCLKYTPGSNSDWAIANSWSLGSSSNAQIGDAVVYEQSVYIFGVFDSYDSNKPRHRKIMRWQPSSGFTHIATLSTDFSRYCQGVVYNNSLYLFGADESYKLRCYKKSSETNSFNEITLPSMIGTASYSNFCFYSDPFDNRLVLIKQVSHDDATQPLKIYESTDISNWTERTGVTLKAGVSCINHLSVTIIKRTGEDFLRFMNINSSYYAEIHGSEYTEYFNILNGFGELNWIEYRDKLLVISPAYSETVDYYILEYSDETKHWSISDIYIPHNITGADYRSSISGHVGVYKDDLYYIGGGSTGRRCYKLTDNNTWQQVADLPVQMASSSYGTLIEYGDYFYAIAVSPDTKTQYHRFDGTSWTTFTDLPCSRADYYVRFVVHNGLLYGFGDGYTGTYPNYGYDSTKVYYTYDGNTWKSHALNLYFTDCGTIADFNGTLLLIGGIYENAPYNASDLSFYKDDYYCTVYEFDDTTETLKRKQKLPARYDMGRKTTGNFVYHGRLILPVRYNPDGTRCDPYHSIYEIRNTISTCSDKAELSGKTFNISNIKITVS